MSTLRVNSVTLNLCPRCEQEFYLPYGQGEGLGEFIRVGVLPLFPALSRASRGEDDAPIYVCSPCGQDEAMQEHFGGSVIPPESWPIKREEETHE